MKRYTPWLIAVALAFSIWVQIAIIDRGEWSWRIVVGLALIVPSFALWALARHQLGDSFTPRAEARQLVTRGLYARIRHPIYLFAEGLSLGIIILLGLPMLLVPWAAAVVWQIRRARRENRVLEAAFGDEYRRYASHTWL